MNESVICLELESRSARTRTSNVERMPRVHRQQFMNRRQTHLSSALQVVRNDL